MNKLYIDDVLLNCALLASMLSLFITGLPLKLMAVLLTFSYSVSLQNLFLKAHRHGFIWFSILPIGAGLCFATSHAPIDVVRDMYFFSIPYVYCLAGLMLRLNGVDCRALVLRCARIYCGMFIFFAARYYFDEGYLNIQAIRDFVSPGSFLLPLAIVFLYREQWSALLTTPLFWLAQAIFLLQSSRTYSIILLAFFMFFRKSRELNRTLSFLLILALLALLGWLTLFDIPDILSMETLHKAYLELSFKDVWTEADMGTSYRAFEAYSAYVAFSGYGVVNMLAGGGFGALVPLEMPVMLAGAEYNAVPWMHNGFMFLLIKTGFAGVVSYGLFFCCLMRSSYFLNDFFHGQLLRMTILAILLANIVICGMFTLEFSFGYILLGYCFASAYIVKSDV